MGELDKAHDHDEDHDEEPFGVEQVPHSPRERYFEFGVTFLLAFAALLSAWAAYQSQRYSGQQNHEFRRASVYQVESLRSEGNAAQKRLADLAAFQEWFGFASRGEDAAAELARARFSAELRPAFDEWIATDPLTSPAAAASPFEGRAYRLAAFEEASDFRERASDMLVKGEQSDTMADRYVLMVVLLALAMFLLGIQSRIGLFELRAALGVTAAVVILGTTLWMILGLDTVWPG